MEVPTVPADAKLHFPMDDLIEPVKPQGGSDGLSNTIDVSHLPAMTSWESLSARAISR